MATVKRERLKPRGRRSNKKLVSGQSAALASPERWAMFGPPQLLQGEDAAAYDQLPDKIMSTSDRRSVSQ